MFDKFAHLKAAYKLARFAGRAQKIVASCPNEVKNFPKFKKILEEIKPKTPQEYLAMGRERFMPLYCPECLAKFKELEAEMAQELPGFQL